MRRTGFTLIATLWFISMVGILGLAMTVMLSNARYHLRVKQHRLAAREMARSGLEYAQARQLRARFDSPLFVTGRFRVEPWGEGYRATGYCGDQIVVEVRP